MTQYEAVAMVCAKIGTITNGVTLVREASKIYGSKIHYVVCIRHRTTFRKLHGLTDDIKPKTTYPEPKKTSVPTPVIVPPVTHCSEVQQMLNIHEFCSMRKIPFTDLTILLKPFDNLKDLFKAIDNLVAIKARTT